MMFRIHSVQVVSSVQDLQFRDCLYHPANDRPTPLRTELPLRFHGQYAALTDPNVVLSPFQAPEFDVLAMDNNPALIDAALAHADVFSSNNRDSDGLISKVRRLLCGEIAMRKHWRLWQIGLDDNANLWLYFVHREDPRRLQNVNLPLLQQLSLSFRMLSDDPNLPPQHKIYLDIQTTPRYGRELKVSEWREGYHLTQVTWYLDTSTVILKDAVRAGGYAAETLRNHQ